VSLHQEPVVHEGRRNTVHVGKMQSRKMKVNTHPFSVIYSLHRACNGAGCAEILLLLLEDSNRYGNNTIEWSI